MVKNLWTKGFVFVIIGIFIGASFSSINLFKNVRAYDGELAYDPNDEILNFIQLTDTHVQGENDVLTDNFKNAIEAVNLIEPDLLFITGDIADDGKEEYYEEFIDIVCYTLKNGIRWYTVPGNHDYYDVLHLNLDYKNNIDNPPIQRDLSNEFSWFSEKGYRFIGLDSIQTSITGFYGGGLTGEIKDDQLEWLENDLESSDDKQYIVFMHHPVFTSQFTGLTWWGIGDDLANRDEFIDDCILNNVYGNDRISLVLTGHVHSDGVWRCNGAVYEDGHYVVDEELLDVTDSSYFDNIGESIKSTKFIHTRSCSKDSSPFGYRLVQLFGENAIYRAYDINEVHPLPKVIESLHLPKNPSIGNPVNIFASIDGETPGVRTVRCYWTLNENNWNPANFITMNHLDGSHYSTSEGIDTFSLSLGDKVFYKVIVENQHNYLDVSDTKSFTIGEPKGLDLIFVIDTTGSMYDDINAVKSSATDIINNIDSQITNYRIAVVDYRDFPYYPYGAPGDYPYNDVLSFSSNKNNILSAIQSLSLGNGMDWDESVYSALLHAIDSTSLGNWRGEDIAAKMIILMCDAPPHDPEPYTDYTLNDVVVAAENADPVHIFPIQIGGTVEKMSELAEQTGGVLFTARSASEIVDTILEAIQQISTNPIANADGPYETSVNIPITLDATSSYDLDGFIVSYEWDLDNDGQFDDAFGATPTIFWTTLYSGDINLKVTDNDGNTDFDTTTISITISSDTAPPITIKSIGNPKYGENDEWITSNIEFNLTATDDISGVDVTYYRIWFNGAWTPWSEYTGNFTLTSEGTHYLEYYSVDTTGNVEVTHNQTHYVDDSPPIVTISASPNSLWPPNNKMKNVLVGGSATDAVSGIASITFTVEDEYDLVEPTLTGFGQTIQLQAMRYGYDMDGRTYTITATATDNLGHIATASAIVLVPHDQGN